MQYDDNTDTYIALGGFILVILLLSGMTYGPYKYGRFVERRNLTAALGQALEDMYYTGRGDAEADCRAGLIK